MEASKLVINPDHIRFRPMSRGKRAKLRRENIKALIRSKPAGTPIPMAEFEMVTQSSQGSTYSMLKRLIKIGEVQRITNGAHKRVYSYVVTDGITVTKPATPQQAIAPLPQPDKALDVETIVEKAKTFAWQEDSDSLRRFIKWLTKEQV